MGNQLDWSQINLSSNIVSAQNTMLAGVLSANSSNINIAYLANGNVSIDLVSGGGSGTTVYAAVLPANVIITNSNSPANVGLNIPLIPIGIYSVEIQVFFNANNANSNGNGIGISWDGAQGNCTVNSSTSLVFGEYNNGFHGNLGGFSPSSGAAFNENIGSTNVDVEPTVDWILMSGSANVNVAGSWNVYVSQSTASQNSLAVLQGSFVKLVKI